MEARVGYEREYKRIWPTLLSAAAEAARRAAINQRTHLSTDIFTSLILSRTSLDAYLHEFLSLRQLSLFVELESRIGGHAAAPPRRILAQRHSIKGATKTDKKKFSDVRALPFREKMQTILLLLGVEPHSPLLKNFDRTFLDALNLNTLRNAIVHHEFEAPSQSLKRVCQQVQQSLNLPKLVIGLPWEDLLLHSELAKWSCDTAAKTLLALEEIECRRTIHFNATSDVVRSALSALTNTSDS
jgi:hypothetical protein